MCLLLVFKDTGRFCCNVSCDARDFEATTSVLMSILWYLLLAGVWKAFKGKPVVSYTLPDPRPSSLWLSGMS